MKVYFKNENCVLKGKIVGIVDEPDEELEQNGDLSSYSGSEEEIIAEASQRLMTRTDKRPGGAGDAFSHLVARNILNNFNVSYYFDETSGSWKIGSKEEVNA